MGKGRGKRIIGAAPGGGGIGRRRFFVALSPPTLPSDAGTPANPYTTVSTRHGRSPRIDVLAAAQNGRRRHPFEKAHIAVCVPAERFSRHTSDNKRYRSRVRRIFDL